MGVWIRYLNNYLEKRALQNWHLLRLRLNLKTENFPSSTQIQKIKKLLKKSLDKINHHMKSLNFKK